MEGVAEEWHEKIIPQIYNSICVNFCAGICIKRYSMLIYKNIKWQLSEDNVSGNFYVFSLYLYELKNILVFKYILYNYITYNIA